MPLNLLLGLLIGLAAGAHTSTWGMYKDAPHEGFTWPKYFRSIILSTLIGVMIVLLAPLDLTRASNMIVLFGVIYVTERALSEFYKTFLREGDQSKYTIPMQLAVQGAVVQSRSGRLLVGLCYLLGILAVIGGLSLLEKAELPVAGVAVVLLIGSVGGWISALGGAWKDAPIEGFETLKFFRSPSLALAYSLLLANFTENYIFIAMGALGYTIATIETYKTFFFPSRPRGKFAGKEILFPEMLQKRQRFIPLYGAIWAALLLATAVAFVQPHHGLI